jgi:hypothetical protein
MKSYSTGYYSVLYFYNASDCRHEDLQVEECSHENYNYIGWVPAAIVFNSLITFQKF